MSFYSRDIAPAWDASHGSRGRSPSRGIATGWFRAGMRQQALGEAGSQVDELFDAFSSQESFGLEKK